VQIEHLKYFYEVSIAKNLTKVAKSSHITQPALSQMLQKIEDNLGCQLFIRNFRGIELTDAGKIVQKYTRNIIKTYDRMLEELNVIKKYPHIIRIEACPTMATYALPCTLYKIKEAFPNYNYSLTSHFSEDVEQNLMNDVCDIGFIHGKPSEEKLIYTKVGEDRLIAVASPNFPIKENIQLKEIRDYPLIMLHDKYKIRQEINKYLQDRGYNISEYKVLFDLDSIESVKATVIKGYGLSILPYIALKKEIYTKQLKEINILDFEMSYEIYLIHKEEKEINLNNKKFIAFLKKVGEKSFC
jgi:DNA-binding transcriptional LysR family regulator